MYVPLLYDSPFFSLSVLPFTNQFVLSVMGSTNFTVKIFPTSLKLTSSAVTGLFSSKITVESSKGHAPYEFVRAFGSV